MIRMQTLIISLFLFFVLFPVSFQLEESCTITCEPQNEFDSSTAEGDVPVTAEWQEFMNSLTSKTFETYSALCPDNQKRVTINKDSKYIWDLRFKIYSERQDKLEKTLNDCYCQETDCGNPFKDCMKGARTAMLEDIKNIWQTEIDKELDALKIKNC